jgi:hypothetical protein
MQFSIMNEHGRAAMMRNTSTPVSQFQFQTTPNEVTAAKTTYGAAQCRVTKLLELRASDFPPSLAM